MCILYTFDIALDKLFTKWIYYDSPGRSCYVYLFCVHSECRSVFIFEISIFRNDCLWCTAFVWLVHWSFASYDLSLECINLLLIQSMNFLSKNLFIVFICKSKLNRFWYQFFFPILFLWNFREFAFVCQFHLHSHSILVC